MRASISPLKPSCGHDLTVTRSHGQHAERDQCDTLEKLNFVFLRDISPVASMVTVPLVMMVHPSFPARSVSEFIAYAKAHPGKINFGSSGNGSTLHVTAEMFKMMAGVNMAHVAYRGSAPMLTDLLAGQIQVAFADMPPSVERRAHQDRHLARTGSHDKGTLVVAARNSDDWRFPA